MHKPTKQREEQDPAVILQAIRHAQKWQTRTLVILAIAILGVAGFAYDRAANTQDAVCAFRADKEQQLRQSEEFLLEHPEGLPKFGFTAQDIRDGIERDRRTVDSLDELNC